MIFVIVNFSLMLPTVTGAWRLERRDSSSAIGVQPSAIGNLELTARVDLPDGASDAWDRVDPSINADAVADLVRRGWLGST